MSSGTTETTAWTSTRIDQVQVSFGWTIENFSQLLNVKKTPKTIRSPNFYSDGDEDTQWYLELNPRGKDDNKDYVSVYLTLDSTMQSEVVVAYKLSITNSSGQHVNSFREETRFVEGDVHGKDNLISRSAILDKSRNLCVQDALTINCQITSSRVRHTSRQKKSLADHTTESNLAEELASFLGDVRFSDLVFHVRGREFPAHKVIVAARSPILLAHFQESSGKQHRIDVKEVEPEVFQQALKYVYTGQVDHLDTMAAPLLAVADKYALNHLKSICEDSLIRNMNSSNVGSIYMLADVHSAEHLKNEALKLIQQRGGLGALIVPRH